MSIQLPVSRPFDTDEVECALSVARRLYGQADREGAIRWLRRAGEAASSAGDDARSLELFRCAADIASLAQAAPTNRLPPRERPSSAVHARAIRPRVPTQAMLQPPRVPAHPRPMPPDEERTNPSFVPPQVHDDSAATRLRDEEEPPTMRRMWSERVPSSAGSRAYRAPQGALPSTRVAVALDPYTGAPRLWLVGAGEEPPPDAAMAILVAMTGPDAERLADVLEEASAYAPRASAGARR